MKLISEKSKESMKNYVHILSIIKLNAPIMNRSLLQALKKISILKDLNNYLQTG